MKCFVIVNIYLAIKVYKIQRFNTLIFSFITQIHLE
jgi:hypothetical protein